MCKLLEDFETLTYNLPKVPCLEEFKLGNRKKATYIFDNGVVNSENLYSVAEVAIAKTSIKKGITFDTHKHNISGEWLIVLDGVLRVFVDTVETVLYKYDSIKISPTIPHHAIAVEDTTFIAITIPRDEGFPD